MASLKTWTKTGLLLVVAGGLVFFGYQAGSDSSETLVETETVVPLPLVLEQVRSLGELRTAEYTYQNVFEYETKLEPKGWAEHIPGADLVVGRTTRNHALVSAHGTVQAGIDLEQAVVERDETGVTVYLPEPEVYRPVIDAKIHREKSGLVWEDHNLGFKAQRDAQDRFTEASLEQGILSDARDSAEAQIRALVEPMLSEPLKIEFREAVTDSA